ncbi:MAG TPA: hypothetical protein VIY86_03665, partial [Pirellulaceae bacterium]
MAVRSLIRLLCGGCLLFGVHGRQFAAEPGQSPTLAPGVLREVPAEPEEAETTSAPRELLEITQAIAPWTPHFSAKSEILPELGKNVILRRPIWQIKFSYKPLRMVSVPVRDSSGALREKAV